MGPPDPGGADGAGDTVRRRLLEQCGVHALLRLHAGIFYADGVKANALFSDRMPPSENPWTQRLWIYDFRTNLAPGDEWRDEGTTSEYASQCLNHACPRRTQIGRRVSSNACQMAQAASWRTRPLLHFRSAAELPVSTAGKYSNRTGSDRTWVHAAGR